MVINRLIAAAVPALMLAGSAGDKIWPYTTQFGLTLLWIAAILTLYTGYDYLRAAFRHVTSDEG